ncbi:MAG: Hsp20/alpha crystallin family protein [Dehalococcoidia bacterium]
MSEQQATAVMEPENTPATPSTPTIFDQIDQEFGEWRRRMTELFRRPFASLAGPPLMVGTAWAPRADAFRADGGLVIKAELPGVKQEDIRLTVQDGVLTIEGTRQEDKEVKDARAYMAERFRGAFARSFALPDGVDTAAITATYTDGVLEVRVPLPAPAATEPTTFPITT